MIRKSMWCSLLIVAMLIVIAPGPAHAQKVAFVTSVTGPGDLGSWQDAITAGKTGVDAGDAVCQARALAAGLANPGDFVAWLSDGDDDAYCRLHGLEGTVDAVNPDCGQMSLPADAGPWVRTDGTPFAADITQMLDPNGVVFTPALLDENGQEGTYYYWTGTRETGELDGYNPNPCLYWTSPLATDEALAGATVGTTRLWTDAAGTFCHYNQALLCLEGGGGGPPLTGFITDERLVFLTSVAGSGDLSTWADAGGMTGIEAGDAICRARATAGGLADASSFKAWLSDSSIDAKNRFVNDGRWVRLDGIPVANSIDDLVDGQLFTSINVTEFGEYFDGEYSVWTGTDEYGVLNTEACSDWADGSSSSQGRVGGFRFIHTWWTKEFSRTCEMSHRLYCFSDAVATQFFTDGFEDGTTSRWSAVVN